MADLEQALYLYQQIDRLLISQLEAATRGADPTPVIESKNALLNELRGIAFKMPELEQAREKLICSLDEVGSITGFPQFTAIRPGQPKLREELIQERDKIDSDAFLSCLLESNDQEFEASGIKLNIAPKDWLKENDILLTSAVDPDRFRQPMSSRSPLRVISLWLRSTARIPTS